MQTWCYCRYILQASLDKNAAQDAPKHAISNEKFKNFMGGQGEGSPPPHTLSLRRLRRLDLDAFGVSKLVAPFLVHTLVDTFRRLCVGLNIVYSILDSRSSGNFSESYLDYTQRSNRFVLEDFPSTCQMLRPAAMGTGARDAALSSSLSQCVSRIE